MQNYIALFTLLTFYSVVVFAGIQEVLNVAKCIADIHQELPTVVFSSWILSERGKVRIFFLAQMVFFF